MNNDTLIETVETLDTSPFKKMVMTIGELPTSFIESMTYYEMLAWFCDYLQNTVIPTVNNNADVSEELQNKYIELHDYVENYFDNLNVQEEINQKLDNMAMDGSLTALIADYVTPIQEAFEAEINENIEETTAAQNTRISRVENLVSSAVSGTPLVASSTSEMTDTNRIYVNSSNGHWYYYDGSSWQDGGTYQATALDDNSVDTNNLVTPLQSQFQQTIIDTTEDITVENGYYITHNGNKTSTPAFSLYGPFYAEKGDIISFTAKGYNTNVSLLSLAKNETDYTGQFATPIIVSEDSNEVSVDYTCLYTGNYYISSLTATGAPKLFIYKKLVKDDENFNIKSKFINNLIIDSKTYPSTSITSQKYIKYDNGNANDVTGYVYSVTDYIEVNPRSQITLECNIPTFKTNAVDAAGYAFYDSEQHYVSGIQMPINTQTVTMNVPANAKYIRLTVTNLMLHNRFTLYYSNIMKELEARTEQSMNEDVTKGLCDNCVFIGDSLTVGQYYTSNSSSYRNYYNYPYFLKKIMDINNIEEYARSGATVTSWWNEFANDITAENSIYFIWLGTNSTLTDTIDTDCVGDDYTQYANTETGNFGKILQKINSLNGNKIVLINLFATVGNLNTNNEVIEKLKTRFGGLTVVDMQHSNITEQIYHTAPNGYYNAVHFNNKGNNKVAQLIRDELANYLQTNNIEMFKAQV